MAPSTRRVTHRPASGDASDSFRIRLPAEIWWLILQEYQEKQDFRSLYDCARVNKSFANLALPLLYSIQENSDASMGDASVFDKGKLIRLWRSIILSSTGQTSYPYCLWIKALPLGSLEFLLDGITRDTLRKAELFAPPLQDLLVEKDVNKTRASKARSKFVILDTQQIISMVADRITAYVKESADRDDRVAALASLEGYHPPADSLPTWVSRLSLLSSLTLRDGKVLGPKTAEAIKAHCPLFKELRCHLCMGDEVDMNMAGFLNTLPENTMETFTIISMNELGEETFKALGHHARALKSLSLSSIRDSEWQHLGALGACTALEDLSLEGRNTQPNVNWEAEDKQSFLEVIAWLKECRQLRRLEMIQVPTTTPLLGQVLKSPTLSLRSLRLQMLETASDDAFWPAIGLQIKLRTLLVRWKDEQNIVLTGHQRRELVNSICACLDLTELDLMNAPLDFDDILRVQNALRQLEDFTFDGDWPQDPILLVLAQMPALKALSINAISSFTFQGIMDFINLLDQDKGAHTGFQLNIMNQNGADKLSEEEETMLQWEMENRLKGRLDIQNWRDPDELHEDDELFSD